MKNKMIYLGIFLALALTVMFTVTISSTTVSAVNATVCCEKTKSNLFCQNVPAEECAIGAQQAPTSCESTSFCKAGYCYDSGEGTCAAKTPQIVCNNANGTWSETFPPQCELGCCILGDQAAFVPLVRCKRLSSFLGLQTNYNKAIKDEVSCVLSVQNQDKGACVYDFEFERICKFTTRSECSAGVNGTSVQGEFFKDKLCSAEELGTKCGPTQDTICVPGKDGVYFKDSCGNAANIYDASKINDKEYWTNVKDPSESCNTGTANANSASCGNCNYLLGSFCRDTETAGAKATYGDNICADLNCKNTENGKSYKHGESWCVFDDEGKTGEGKNSVGSRFYKHICINGEEVLEQCADFRQEECIEDKIETPLGDFAQAACRVNRWQDCTVQTEKRDCENSDRRDCIWRDGISIQTANKTKTRGVCLPENPPGLKFWEGEEAKNICALGNAKCVVTYEKGLFGGEKCVDGCECLTPQWEKERSDICVALGDCGPNINWIGEKGYKEGFKVTIGKPKKGN